MNNSNLEKGCTFDDCYTEQALIFLPQVQTAFLVLYGTVSSIGALGNLFILVTVIRYLVTFPTSRLSCWSVCVCPGARACTRGWTCLCATWRSLTRWCASPRRPSPPSPASLGGGGWATSPAWSCLRARWHRVQHELLYVQAQATGQVEVKSR